MSASFRESRIARGLCPSCEVLWVNGRKCHESDCPDAWRDSRRSCQWCGTRFTPSEPNQTCCDDSCWRSFVGLPEAEPTGACLDDACTGGPGCPDPEAHAFADGWSPDCEGGAL